MRVQRTGLGVVAIGAAVAGLVAAPVSAANSSTFRDCSFSGGFDPDFVRIMGATIGPGGQLTVPQSQNAVTVEGSESSDPGDSNGHDTLNVAVGTGAGAPRTVSGAGTGHVTLTVPLSGGTVGGTYTIGWSATFDNGFHSCPSSQTPQNSSPSPFVLKIVAAGTSTAPTLTGVAQAHKLWRLPGNLALGRKHPVATTFSLVLNEPARLTLVFTEILGQRRVRRGEIVVAGKAGRNTIRFRGRTTSGRRLRPGRYRVKLTATSAAGQRSAPSMLKFRVLK